MKTRAKGSRWGSNYNQKSNQRKTGRRKTSRRFETLESRRLLAGDMTNPENPLDVNNDAAVSASDALAIINYLGRQTSSGEGEQVGASNGSGDLIYPDTNGNGSVAASDALRVINALAEGEVVEPPAPDLSVTSVVVNEAQDAGTATLANSGSTDTALAVKVRVSVQINGQQVQLGDFDAMFAQGAATTTVTVPFSALATNNIPTGTYEVTVMVDSDDTVNETVEANNSLTTSLIIQGVDVVPMSAKFRTGSSPHVELSGNDQNVVVTSPNAGQLRFQGMDLDRTISIRRDLKVKIRGTGNQLVFNNASIPDDLFVYFYGSNNAIRLNNTSVADDFIFHGSDGADVVALDGGTRIHDTTVIKGKDGNDQILLSGASIGNDLIVYGHDGNDTFAANNVAVGDDAIIRMGDHNDAVSIQNVAVRDVADVEGDRHTDSLAVGAAVTARRYDADDFETNGPLQNVQALIDQVFANMAATT